LWIWTRRGCGLPIAISIVIDARAVIIRHIDEVVAVIVDFIVTDLRGSWMDVGICVIAIQIRGYAVRVFRIAVAVMVIIQATSRPGTTESYVDLVLV
jgi:hypothetical protein